MAAHKRPAAAAVLLLLHSLAYANAASLEILPSGETQTKPVGSSIILTCRPSVDDPKLISQMQWLDSHNRVIESLKLVVLPIESTHQENTKPEMYTELNPDNSLSLFINHLEEKQGGKYTCTGTYANSVPLNKTVAIETIDAITWVNAPPDQYPILGEDFSILCKVRARPSPSVNWLYNGELIKPNERYTIDTDVLKIQNVQESDDGVYTCRASVTSTGELQERAIRVEVHVKPTIEEIPSPVEIIEGENANIECIAKGKPPPKYSWVKSLTQQNLSNADGFGVDPDTGILTITNANRDDAGEYQCIAKNAADSATTAIIINVIVKPKIMEFENSTIVQGKKVEISCKAFGRPPPQITFRKHTSEKPYVMSVQPDDDTIILTNRPDDNSGETVGTLSIDQAMRSNDGLYECIAQNRGGLAYKTGHLTVEFPPSFASMPNITVWSWEQRPVNISCIAESIPNATIRWTMHGDQKIENNAMITQYGHGPVSILTIVPVDKRYYTSYKCIAANPHGTREHTIELREATKPGELAQAIMSEVTATTIKFELIPPTAHPELPIRTITVQYKENRQTWAEAKNKTWSVGSMYAIEGLMPQTMYEFRFAAGNEVGLGNWGKNHMETTPGRSVPKMPIMIKTSGAEYEVSQHNSQYELSWLTPADNGEPIDKYDIRYCPIKRESGEWIDQQDSSCSVAEVRGSGRTRYWLKNLEPDSFYRIELKAHNAMGFSDPSIGRVKTARGVVDTTVVHHQGPLISSAAIIGIVIAVLFIIIIVIDVICCCAHKTGIIYYVCERSRRKPVDEDDAKLGRDEKEPLKEEKKITPIIDTGLRRETSITFDGKRSISKTGFVGKDSAV